MMQDLYFRWFSKHWNEATDRLKNINTDWSKWKIVPEQEGNKYVSKRQSC